MAAITYATMQTRVKLNLGNMQSTHPLVTYVPDWVNEALNRVILLAASKDRRAANIFPELQNRTWTDVTVNAQDYLTIPAGVLVLDGLTCTRLTTTYNSATQTEYPIVEQPDPQIFNQLTKTSTGWPVQWKREGGKVKLWPTPSSSPTNYLTQVIFYGLMREADLTGSATPVMDALWHPAIIDYASYLGATALGWDDDAQKWLTAAEQKVTMTLNLVGLERQKNDSRITIAGMPGGQ